MALRAGPFVPASHWHVQNTKQNGSAQGSPMQQTASSLPATLQHQSDSKFPCTVVARPVGAGVVLEPDHHGR